MRPQARDTTVFGAVAALSAIEFLIADDHSRGFFFAPENVDRLSVAEDMSGLGSARSVR
jgi:hypothetical protein